MRQPKVARPPREWSRWWVALWVAIVAVLLPLAPFMYVWDWLTLAAVLFGVPETIGTVKQDDAYPPLTHVIVRYVNAELSVPFMVGMAGGIGSHWLEAGRPFERGVLFAFCSWVLVHFLLRYVPRQEP